eukprot:CAMPEP_0173123292 /NCGR_PEP_ID=MMETSP1102-20130122/54837_1 /TAXON_ID=49646 /ORGANISM="Geminigera sp., Strain Caron Lab Isolate" /LENGTH=370 /DNA_ID=CAMNT_0014031147 /DNA_START=66 /DNA_END=1179 /DNA_ORIENTATION=+
MLARRVAKGLVANSQRQSARFLSTAAAGDWVVSPAAGTLLAGNPSIDIKALAAKCAAHSPGSGKVIITKGDVLVALGKIQASALTFLRAATPFAAAGVGGTVPAPAGGSGYCSGTSSGGSSRSGGSSSGSTGTSCRGQCARAEKSGAQDAPDTHGHSETQMRKIIAKRLLESKLTLPHSYMAIEIEMDSLMATRAKFNKANSSKVSVNDLALKTVPEANAYWTEDAIKFNSQIDVSFAAATPSGLITPVVKDAGKKAILEISAEAKDMATRARANKLMPEEFTGGCTSVSNLGMFDISEFIAVLNPPQSTIFAVGSTSAKAFPDGKGGIEARNVMRVSVTHDARVVDAFVAEKLCGALKDGIENPALIFM